MATLTENYPLILTKYSKESILKMIIILMMKNYNYYTSYNFIVLYILKRSLNIINQEQIMKYLTSLGILPTGIK
jgi:hypothetical protein